jgi:ParB family chromosome partitioning protein
LAILNRSIEVLMMMHGNSPGGNTPAKNNPKDDKAPVTLHASHAARTEQPKRRALGKGLESLLRPSAPHEATPNQKAMPADKSGAEEHVDEGGTPREIPVNQIDANPYQTRTRVDEQQLAELSRSIEANGVVQPIIVRPLANGRFQLIAGERRWRASEKAGKATVPAILRKVSDEQAMEMTIVENLQRADLNPIEQARAYERLGREFKVTQEQMALRTGKDRASVTNFLRLLKLPVDVQDKVGSGELSFGHAKILMGLDSPEIISKAVAKIVALSMSVRQTETYVQGFMNPEKRSGDQDKKLRQPLDANVRAVQEHLQRELGLKVRIEDKNGKGRVVIEYTRLEDFDSIMATLGGAR